MVYPRRWATTISPTATPTFPKPVIRYAYYLFVFSLPFEGAMGGLFLLGLILAGSTLSQPRLFLKRPPKAFWCFGVYFFVIAVLGLVTILTPPHDWEITMTIIRRLIVLLQLFVFFLIAYRLMTFEAIAKRTLVTFALSCVLFALLQAGGVFATEEIGPKGQERMASFGDNPNTVASVLGVGLLSLFGLAYGGQNMSIRMRLLAWLTSGLLLVAIVQTGARGNLLALVVALIALTVRPSVIAERVKIVMIALVVIVSLSFVSYQIDAVRERWEKTFYEGDVSGRQNLLPAAWGMFLEKPVIGWGPVTHSYEMGIRTLKKVGDPHNLYLWLLLECGLVGTIPFAIGLWLCWGSAWRARHSMQGSLPVSLLFFWLAVNMKGTYFSFKLFWVVLAYGLASESYALARGRRRLENRPLPTKRYRRQPFLRESLT